MDVLLVRHAIAENRDPNQWPDDAVRPLTIDGARSFRRAARGLRRVAADVDHVLSSPYTRAAQTAEILHVVTGWPPAELRTELAARSAPADAVELLINLGASAAVALVGHEPFLSSLASLLLTGDGDGVQILLKKGGVVCLRCARECEPGQAVLSWHVTPKLLRRLDA
jgi:phosphohistidine phosphatase